MLTITSRRVTDIVVTIVAQGHIYNPHIPITAYIGYILSDSITVLYTSHYHFLATSFIEIYVIGRITQSYIFSVPFHLGCNLPQQSVGISCCLCKCIFVTCALRYISNHGHGIKPAFVHLVQIDERNFTSLLKPIAFFKQHRSVTM